MTKKTKFKVVMTSRFKKDYKKIKKLKSFNENEFKNLINMLANDDVLLEKYHNHILEPKSKRDMGVSFKT